MTKYHWTKSFISLNLLVLLNDIITMVNSAEFAKRLSEILDYYGISAAAFSDMVAVNRSTISHLLSGRNKPSLEFVLKVLSAFPEVELYWLLNGEGHFPTLPKNQDSRASDSEVSQNTIRPDTVKIQRKNTSPLDNTPKEEPKHEGPKTNNGPTYESEDGNFGAIERIVVFYQNGKFKTYTP